MKYFLWTVGAVLFVAVAMAGWSVAGRFMTAKDDLSVAIGVVIVGTLLGLVASGVTFLVRKAARSFSGVASIDPHRDQKL